MHHLIYHHHPYKILSFDFFELPDFLCPTQISQTTILIPDEK